MTVSVKECSAAGRGRISCRWLAGSSLAVIMLAFGPAPRVLAAGILTQGGNAGIVPVTSSITSTLAAEQQANVVAAQAQNQLSRIATAMQAMQNLQTAAHNLSLSTPSAIPSGLQSGGLVPDNPATWTAAQTPTETTAGSTTTVSINQTAAHALLSWNSFNVAKNTIVDFNQHGNASWVALNNIASANPSQIFGSIKASGQVYLINQNGIIFGGTSQINVGSLIASSAAISDSQFLTDGIFSSEAGTSYKPSFTDAGAPITVAAGAEITTNTPTTVTSGGGFVLMLGTQVRNAGSITTPDGQTELAAGDNFLIRPGYSTTSNTTSTTRGNEIAVELNHAGSSLQPGGSGLVENTGAITADTGDITLAGETLVQDGQALSTTSVAVRGTIHLLSSASDTFSSVTLGSAGYTLIEPDISSSATELASQRAALIADSVTANAARAAAFNKQFADLSLLNDEQDESRVEIVTGGVVHFADGSDSSAPGGQLAVSAAERVQVDEGALLDVSGSYDVPMAMASNDIAVNIQDNELRDNPQNRLTQDLRNSTVYVDAQTVSLVPASAADPSDRDYTPGGLLEVSGYLANIGYGIGEYSSIGGSIDLSTGSAGAIVAQDGSSFDIDGGTLQYASGYLPQSYLLGSDGRIYNVNNAPADLTYTGVFDGYSVDHAAWGVTQTYANVLNAPAEIYSQGYTVGRAAGSLTLTSPTTIFDGTIEAAAANGSRQIAADPAGISDPSLLTQTEIAAPGSLDIETANAASISAVDSDVIFSNAQARAAASGQKIQKKLTGETLLNAASLDRSGLGTIQVVTNGSIRVAAPINAAPGGQVNLYGSSVDLAASITAAGGSVSAGQVTTLDGTQVTLKTPGKHGGVGDTVVGENVTISTAGLWTNLLLDPSITFGQAFANGGAVDLGSAATLRLAKGSVIDTSAGGVVSVLGAVAGGSGGAITLAAATPSDIIIKPKGDLILRGTLAATGYTQGGALTLAAPGFLITSKAATAKADLVTLDPAFFAQGFSAYNLQSTGDISIAHGTAVDVTEPIFQISASTLSQPTGAASAQVFARLQGPLYVPNSSDTAITQRPGASFSAVITSINPVSPSDPSVHNHTALTIGSGASITVDPGRTINLQATGQLTIDGSLTAPGGTISAVSEFNSYAALPKGPGTVSVWVGNGATLDASAQPVSFENAAGQRIAEAPAGGSITLGSDSSTAAVIIRAGAVIEASGSAASDEIAASELTNFAGTAQPAGAAIPLRGAGGSISIASDEGIYNDGALIAAAGGATAAGGSLSMTLEADDVLNSLGVEATPRVFTITEAQPERLLPAHLKPGASKGLQAGTASISAQAINAGGFGSVTLFARDAFLFKGNVTLTAPQSISLQEGYLTDTSNHGSVVIDAPYVLLSGATPDENFSGQSFEAISGFSTKKTEGVFTVNAAQIGIADELRFGGVLAADGKIPAIDLAGFGDVDLNSSGDLQFEAPDAAISNAYTNLVTTANLNLTAREIYAMSGTGSQTAGAASAAPSALIVAGYDPKADGKNGAFNVNGVLNIDATAGTTPSAPDTLLGSLTFEAATINQGGVIWQPLGRLTFGSITTTIGDAITGSGDVRAAVNFLPGSITSVSAGGLNIPFGGTTDGVVYNVDGETIAATTNAKFGLQTVTNGAGTGTITIQALSTNVEAGANIDLQGGGTLTGAGFISGEGGSVDVLTTPLLSVGTSGVTQPSLATDPVYAIVAGAQPLTAVAYTDSGASGSDPALGRQIVIPAGVPGLAAGTYTLLPAAYALEPGGYRVEIDGSAALNAASVTALANGSYAVAGYTALAATDVRSTLASNLTITPSAAVVNYADYDQEGYNAYLQASSALIGAIRPILPIDGGTLVLNVPISSEVALTDAGAVSFAPAAGGIGGTLQISGDNISGAEPKLVIYGNAPPAGLARGTVALSASQIDAFDPSTLEIGVGGGGVNANVDSITLSDGATLRAARVVLTALSGGITLDGGSAIDTIGKTALQADSTTEGLLSNNGASVLDVGNGYLVYGTTPVDFTDYGPITVQDGAKIYSDGSIAFSTSAAVNIGIGASYGGKYLDLAVPEINVGNPSALGANAPAGLVLTQAVLQALTQGVPAAGVPAVQILNLTAFDSLNFYGTASLDLTGSNVVLEINTPAIYGFGGASDVATIGASTIVWNGISTTAADDLTVISSLPGGTVTNGPGSGIGTLDLNAQTIILGYSDLDLPERDVTLTRLAAGFSNVNLNAGNAITANNQGSLAVYQSVPDYGQAGLGGTLNLNTPLLTAADAATIGYTAGGAISVGPASGVGAASLASEAAGGEVDLTAPNIAITGSVILPSGKLDLQAADNITLGSGSLLSLAGAITRNVDQTVYGFGGNLIMASAAGNITQNAGSVINVSAIDNSAGSVTITATNAGAGQVALNGALLGGTSGASRSGYDGGVFDISAQSLGDFAALNASLDAGGFFQTRDFDIKQGSLSIGNGVQAHNVSVSLDNGSLTVIGLIDAAGDGGGSISLAASDNLTLAGSASLDAHGTTLVTDSYGVAIASEDEPVVSLTTSKGELTLADGASIDLASADSTARGDLELNVPRVASATSGDANIQAAGRLDITGAASIAVNAFWTYNGLPDPNPTVSGAPDALITQAYLDQINTSDTLPYMENAATNADLAARVAGLSGYSSYHFRPGVAIVSATADGDLTVEGDIDLAGYRYGPGAGAYGAGEPGVLQIRAGGNLNVYGSITDGFEQPISDAGTEFAKGWVIYGGEPYNQNQTIPTAIGISRGSAISDTGTVNFALPITGGSFAAGAIAPAALTVAGNHKTSIAFVATSDITSGAVVLYAKGSFVPAGSIIPAGAVVAPGGSLPFAINVGAVTWPANTPFTVTKFLSSGGEGVVVAADTTLLAGSFIPGGSTLIFQKTDPGLENRGQGDLTYVETRPVGSDGTQGQLYGLASLLPAGDISWSIALVSGADTGAADPDVTQSASALAAAGTGTGNLTLADNHYGIQGDTVVPAFSVVRTGTGSLSLVAGGSIYENSAFGVYTAGAQSAAIVNAAGQNLYDQPQGDEAGTTLLGKGNAALAALVANYAANYPTDGGNLMVSAQGNLNGFISTAFNPNFFFNYVTITDTDAVGEWLWNQGGSGLPGAWWTEYGSLNLTGSQDEPDQPYVAQYTGFQGIGTLGGGNLTVNVGGNAGGLDLVVASNGRVKADGALDQNGGGALDLAIGGKLNDVAPGNNLGNIQDAAGIVSDLRGDTNVSAGSIGTILPQYGLLAAGDPRFLSPYASETADLNSGIDLAPGDGAVTVDSRGDLAIGSAVDPGIVQNYTNVVPVEVKADGAVTAGNGVTDFSLWTSATSIGLFSAGGDVAPAESAGETADQNDTQQNFYPASLQAVSQNGNIYFGTQPVELMPSSDGELELLAAGSIIGDDSIVSMSGAALSMVATPFNPGIDVFSARGASIYTNHNLQTLGEPIDFGPDTPTGALHAGDTQPARIYAASGDIINIEFGEYAAATTDEVQQVRAAKPFEIFAGRDIVNSGSIASPDVFLNLSGNDISSVTAGRDILQSSFDIAGPGALVVQAGRNYDAYGDSDIDSIGPIFHINPNDRNSGSGIALLAGVGTGADYGNFANLFLNPASTLSLQDASGIISSNDATLYTWLQTKYGYFGPATGAYAYFLGLSTGEQAVFLRQLYFAELNHSGLEFNDPSSVHYKSYILGETAIAALFPAVDASGSPVSYSGGITMYGASGVHTNYGGAIETLTPGGNTIVGVEGATPPASAGILTQGTGDIDMYALESVELGESRVLTTFGGNIVIWSAQGDINAGRGSKTTIDYTPLQVLYDNYGNVSLSPTVPSSGAGIGTLNPIPSVSAGNINLVAPLGTIDAGEAGIRSSGNTNLAALVVLNGANITSQGTTTGAPTTVAPNVGALTSTSNVAGAADQAAEGSTGRTQAAPLPSIWIVEILGYGGDTGGGPASDEHKKKRPQTI